MPKPSSKAPPLDPRAVALSAVRVLPGGRCRQYTTTSFRRDPHAGCERFIRQCRAVGYLTAATKTAYAVLDVLDRNGDLVQHYSIPNANAFRFVYRKLGLRVETEDT